MRFVNAIPRGRYALPTNDVFEIGWMVAKSDTDLDLNEEFFAVRKRNLSNLSDLEKIKMIMRRTIDGRRICQIDWC